METPKADALPRRDGWRRMPATVVGEWQYPDTGKWDADRNTGEFVAAMPQWRRHGLLAVTLNLQGGSPRGYSSVQPWHNSAFRADGTLRTDYLRRLKLVLDQADELARNGVYPAVFHELLDLGVAFAPGPYEVLFPSLAHTDADIDATVEACAAAARAVVSRS